ncbi:MAG: tetratricopeptide repeat protein [Thermonemataceae bacterium]
MEEIEKIELKEKLVALLESKQVDNILLGITLTNTQQMEKVLYTYLLLLAWYHPYKEVRKAARKSVQPVPATRRIKGVLQEKKLFRKLTQQSKIFTLLEEMNYFKEIDEKVLGNFFFHLTELPGAAMFCLKYETTSPQQILKTLQVKDSLSLKGFDLDTLPEAVGHFTHLVSLDISRNRFKVLPDSIFKLKKLEYLRHTDTPLSEETLQQIALHLPRLKAKQHFDKGDYLYRSKKYKEALEHFHEATEVEATYAPAWNWKGYTLRALEMYKEATNCYQQCLALDKQDTFAWANLAEALCHLRQYAASLETVEKGLEACAGLVRNYRTQTHEANLLFTKGLNYFWLKDYHACLKANAASLQLNNYAGTWYNNACAYAKLYKKKEMLDALEEALQLKRENYLNMALKDIDGDFEHYYEDEDYQALLERYKEV